MRDLMDKYRRLLHLPHALFTRIDHEEAMVAAVYKISQPEQPDLILKMGSRAGESLREAYFLNLFANKIPVPKVIQTHSEAILMECVEGELLKKETVTDTLAAEIGAILARIHLEQTIGYGDLTDPAQLSSDPRIPFSMKFEEGLQECRGHLPEELLKSCKSRFDKDIDLLLLTDGPCIIHRDFRPGNIIVSDGKVRGIIDWSSGRGGFAEEDFCPLEMGEWPAHCKAAFLEGYATVRKVPDYTAIMPLLLLSRAVAAVGFTIKRGTWNSKNKTLYETNLRHLKSLHKMSDPKN